MSVWGVMLGIDRSICIYKESPAIAINNVMFLNMSFVQFSGITTITDLYFFL